MLLKKFRVVLALVAVGGVGLVAFGAVQQPPRQPSDPLVQEVRQLRVAVERVAHLSPRIELTLQRANAVQMRISSLSWELADVRTQLARASAEVTRNAAYVREFNALQPGIENPGLVLSSPYGEAKRQLEAQTQLEQQLRAREAQTAGALVAEQAKWNELIQQLDALERTVAAGRD